MKNRFRTMGKHASWMLATLAVCGLTTSCKDEYYLDDEKPSYLGSSIYESLQSKGNFTNYLRLVADPDVNPQGQRPLSEVLSRTGSKTVFVANDEAWAAFFAKNATLPESDPWHNATSYDKLSFSQKKLLIHGSMLNNAIVMENLASMLASDGSGMQRGVYMRRETDVVPTDSITFVKAEDFPFHLEEAEETDQWWRFRDKTRRGPSIDKEGIYLVCDSTPSMMVAFTNQYMKNNNITDEDFRLATGMSRVTDDVHINNAKILEQDQVCENGYVNVVDRVLTPLANMSEVLRTNGKTQIFSHMLERWSVPYYNSTVTKAYEDIMRSRGKEWTDSIFSKRYFSDMSYGHKGLTTDPYGKVFVNDKSAILKFDPSWNKYYNEKADPMYDMAAMYVPNDDALWEYFTTPNEKGWDLISTYYIKKGTPEEIPYEAPDRNNLETLFRQIDCIPASTLNSLLNVIMFKSYATSVPSKMDQLRDDANEQIFNVNEDDKTHIVGSLVANNGVVYLTDKVYGPADFTSVAAPAHITKTNLIMKWAIYNGSKTSDTNKMKLNYYAYLKAMQSRFAMFLPSDKALSYFYDVLSFSSMKPRVYSLAYNAKNATMPVIETDYAYDPATGVIGAPITDSKKKETANDDEIVDHLRLILESHTIVLNDELADNPNGIEEDVNNYYLAKNGAPIKITRENGKIVKVQGGFQVANEAKGIEGGVNGADDYSAAKGIQNCLIEENYKKDNGHTYILDSPILGSAQSVKSIVSTNERFNMFNHICTVEDAQQQMMVDCGLIDKDKYKTKAQRTAEMKKYLIFVTSLGIGDKAVFATDENVSFLSNSNYTLYVPSNEAITEAINCGLPTWEKIYEDYESCMDPETKAISHNDSVRIQAKIVFLANFIRYHFCDNSVFVDNSAMSETQSQTFSYNKDNGVFMKLNIKRSAGTPGTLSVKDATGGNWMTVNPDNCNFMARDIYSSKKVREQLKLGQPIIKSESYITVHEIPGVLNHVEIPIVNGKPNYEKFFQNEEAVKRYLEKFQIK
ncbi:MAG: fasciclin domain-containing protein [Bacteroidales bacterium]|nr:fasciclin domain-containing protein [Candidatus Physcousia equi]